jgi:hypothetical protein
MDTTTIILSLENIITLLGIVVTAVIAVVGGIYAVVTNTKKYELTESYKQELLSWYSSVVNVMIRTIHCFEHYDSACSEFTKKKTELLSELSALTEVGRFYFPNVIKDDGFGAKKPSAYQGYRHITLEFLLYFYEIAKQKNGKQHITTMWELERHFTSVIFDMIEPRKKKINYSKKLEITMPKDTSIEDYLANDPRNINIFIS